MALELRQHLKLSQQLVMTPQLQMAIKLLQLSRLELMDTIRQELEENPALEEVVETAGEDLEEAEQLPSEMPVQEVTIEEKIPDEIDWNNYIDEYNSTERVHAEYEKKETPSFESFISKKESLEEHLMWQLMMIFPTREEGDIGSRIIGNLNRDGYLQDIAVEEIAKQCNCPVENVERLLVKMQFFDPIGVCARNLRECLLIQVRHLKLDNTIVTAIINNHLNHLENNNYKAISRALKVGIEDVVAAVKIIQGLEPRPGRQYSDDEPIYITPDIYVYKIENDFVIVLNDDGLPKLRVNSFYKHSLKKGSDLPDQAKGYIQEKLRSAAWLIRSIHQRQKTIYRVMESILKFQKNFFEKGIEHLKPMVLKDVALDINMHESTISRVTTNKYAYTPQGIFELKYFSTIFFCLSNEYSSQ